MGSVLLYTLVSLVQPVLTVWLIAELEGVEIRHFVDGALGRSQTVINVIEPTINTYSCWPGQASS
jgi:hypothetical protein